VLRNLGACRSFNLSTGTRFADGNGCSFAFFSLPVAVFVAALSNGPGQHSRHAGCFEKKALSVLLVAFLRLFFKPSFELIVLTKQKFESFADDVRIGRINELGVLAELHFYLFLYPNL
jgi:hypothetical protein